MRRRLDAAFMRPEEPMEDLRYARVRTDPLVVVFPSDHRLASQEAIDPGEIASETFFLPSKSAPSVRHVVLEYFRRAGVDLKPEHHEVHNVVHAISMLTSTRGVMLLPAYTQRYLPEFITTRPVSGEVPTVDLILAYHKANKSPPEAAALEARQACRGVGLVLPRTAPEARSAEAELAEVNGDEEWIRYLPHRVVISVDAALGRHLDALEGAIVGGVIGARSAAKNVNSIVVAPH
jgi:LysR substrate binding domain